MNFPLVLSDASTFAIGSIIFIVSCIAIFLGIYTPIHIIRSKYKSFVLEHSVALKQLTKINNHYEFKAIPKYDMEHSYDNENFYGDISCKDYLIYQLVYLQKKVSIALRDAQYNKELCERYKKEIKETCALDKYDTEELLKNRKRLISFEKKLFLKELKKPTTNFSINIKLRLTDINGSYRKSKKESFLPEEITKIIAKLNQKRGNFYLNDDIWQAICRVERGKVTNKMRFSIYNRDHYRCRKCGRKTKDLEVDHIIPIAKGGKSTYDNLQTLCHRCNLKKGANIEY